MPWLDRDLIRGWLEKRNWSMARLAHECSALGEDSISEGTMRNAVNAVNPMRPSRIRLICLVTQKYGDGFTFEQLSRAERVQREM